VSGGAPGPGEGAAGAGDARPARASGGLGRVVEAGMSGEAVSAGGVLAVIGGWRGVVESLLPATVYLATYVFTQEPRLSAIAPIALSVLALLVRLIRREPLSAAVSGLVGVLVCAAAVMFTGEGSSYYVPGFWINAAWIAAHTVSLLVGWPLIGLLLGFFRGSLTAWRGVKPLRRAAQVCTVMWIALFAARLAVQLPLYYAGESAIGALGIARLVMGVPLFALAAVFTWLVLSRVSATVPAEERERASTGAED
jgi:hypothetical protein